MAIDRVVLGLSSTVLAGVCITATPASACSYATSISVDRPTEALSLDETPPVLVDLAVEQLSRGRPPAAQLDEQGQEVLTASSCDDLGVLRLSTAAMDAQTTFEDLRYTVTLTEGDSPIVFPSGALQAVAPGELSFIWIDGAEAEQAPFRFQVQVTAVDAAGNESKPMRLWVADPGRTEEPTRVRIDTPQFISVESESVEPGSAESQDTAPADQSGFERGLPPGCSSSGAGALSTRPWLSLWSVAGLLSVLFQRRRR